VNFRIPLCRRDSHSQIRHNLKNTQKDTTA
jgi:hypothetical protein